MFQAKIALKNSFKNCVSIINYRIFVGDWKEKERNEEKRTKERYLESRFIIIENCPIFEVRLIMFCR